VVGAGPAAFPPRSLPPCARQSAAGSKSPVFSAERSIGLGKVAGAGTKFQKAKGTRIARRNTTTNHPAGLQDGDTALDPALCRQPPAPRWIGCDRGYSICPSIPSRKAATSRHRRRYMWGAEGGAAFSGAVAGNSGTGGRGKVKRAVPLRCPQIDTGQEAAHHRSVAPTRTASAPPIPRARFVLPPAARRQPEDVRELHKVPMYCRSCTRTTPAAASKLGMAAGATIPTRVSICRARHDLTDDNSRARPTPSPAQPESPPAVGRSSSTKPGARFVRKRAERPQPRSRIGEAGLVIVFRDLRPGDCR